MRLSDAVTRSAVTPTRPQAVYVNSMEEFAAAIEEHGRFLRPWLAAEFAGVSRQYVDRLVQTGRFRRVYIFSQLHLVESEVVAWIQDRKGVACVL